MDTRTRIPARCPRAAEGRRCVDSLDLRRRCAKEIAQRYGYFDGRMWLREAFESVPRELFVPDLVWWPHKGQDGRYPVLDRARRPEQWLEAVYRPRAALITQIADGAVKPEDGPTDSNDFTSSISCPAVVVNMLRHLDPQPENAYWRSAPAPATVPPCWRGGSPTS